MKRPLFVLMTLLAASACTSTAAKGYGDRLKTQGGETEAIGKSWNEGVKAVARGEDLIRTGTRQIADGERDRDRGDAMIREGNKLKAQAEAEMRIRDAAVTPLSGSPE